jgi:cyanophycin synthetase
MLDDLATHARTFEAWRSWVIAVGLQPTVVIAGSRGKTIVAKVLESVLRSSGLRVATWTSHGVDIDGIRQRGELGPWQEVEDALEAGTIDIGIREVDWATASTLATGPRLPIAAVTNVCSNRQDCIDAGDGLLANVALPALFTSIVDRGWLILNGEDLAVAADLSGTAHNRLLVGLGLDSPSIEDQIDANKSFGSIVDGRLIVAHDGATFDYGPRSNIPFALDGVANILIFDAVMAASIATILGIDQPTIRQGIRRFRSRPDEIPGAFNILTAGNATIILDLPSAPWHLRPILRAIRDADHSRVISVIAGNGEVRETDLAEFGRLLGRITNILIVAQDAFADATRSDRILEGARLNEVPPMVVSVDSELDAVRRALGLSRPRDLIYIVSDGPGALWDRLVALGPLIEVRPGNQP